MITKPDDEHLLLFEGNHPKTGQPLYFERTWQYGKWMYRQCGQLTDRKHAEETLEYWRKRGWECKP